MSETPIPEKKPRPGGLIDRLQSVEPEQATDNTQLKTESDQKRRRRRLRGRNEYISSTTKEEINTCITKWREVLQWKGLMQVPQDTYTSQYITEKTNLLSFRTPTMTIPDSMYQEEVIR